VSVVFRAICQHQFLVPGDTNAARSPKRFIPANRLAASIVNHATQNEKD